MRWHGRRAARGNLGSDRVDHFDIKVSRFQRKLGAVAVQQHVGKDRNRIAAFDHAMDMPNDFNNSERSTVTFIAKSMKEAETRTTKVARRKAFGKPSPAAARGFSMPFYRRLHWIASNQASVLASGAASVLVLSPCARSLRSVLAISPCAQSVLAISPCAQSLRSVLA